jgi:hypothetical protein
MVISEVLKIVSYPGKEKDVKVYNDVMSRHKIYNFSEKSGWNRFPELASINRKYHTLRSSWKKETREERRNEMETRMEMIREDYETIKAINNKLNGLFDIR